MNNNLNGRQFKTNANASAMVEKAVMQILQKNNLLVGNKTFGVVEEIINNTTLQSNTSEIVNCSPKVEYHKGDRVLVEYINNNPHDMFVIALVGGGYEIDQIDYSELPTEPVKIVYNEHGKAYKFIYGYDQPRKTWEQELVRNDEGIVEEIIHYYPDGFVLTRVLIRNDQGRVIKYE